GARLGSLGRAFYGWQLVGSVSSARSMLVSSTPCAMPTAPEEALCSPVNSAAVSRCGDLGQEFCVPPFRVVCPYRVENLFVPIRDSCKVIAMAHRTQVIKKKGRPKLSM